MKKIFVSGAAGFLGSHLIDALLKQGCEVIGCDNLEGGDLANVPKGIHFEVKDCNDNEAMLRLTKGVDTVYHLASSAHEGLSIYSPHHYTKNTFGSAMSVLSASVSNGVNRFILCSSAARYGALPTPMTEDMLPKPQDPYGIAKYASDLVLEEMGTVHGMEWCVAVPHNIIGPRQKYDDPFRNAVSIFANLMLQNRIPIIYGDGEQKRCFSFVSDIVDPLIKMGTLPQANGQIINIGPDSGEVSINEVVGMLAEIIGYTGAIEHAKARQREVRDVLLSADKARKLLGYEPKVTLHDGLVEIVEWIKGQGTKGFQYHLPIEIDSPLMPDTWKNRTY